MAHDIFGGTRTWSSTDWKACDDRVRGGASISTMEISNNTQPPVAVFRGTLDITTLGNAGFASQRSADDASCWTLAAYDGIAIDVTDVDAEARAAKHDSSNKTYTFVLKDEIAAQRPDGRDMSTVSWEYDFGLSGARTIEIAWEDFRPTYRGRECPDARPLNVHRIRRMSFMMRSFFGRQSGDFALGITAVYAFKREKSIRDVVSRDGAEDAHECQPLLQRETKPRVRGRGGWFAWICACMCIP